MYKFTLTSKELKNHIHPNKVLVFEDSTLSCHPHEQVWNTDVRHMNAIQLENSDTGNNMIYFFHSTDKSNGEIVGINYRSKNGQKLLIIND